jgi:hypothetical protein
MAVPSVFNCVFEGNINNKIVIKMELQRNEKTLTGRLYYKKNTNFLNLTGNIDDNGIILLNETFNNKLTGIFNGKIIREPNSQPLILKFNGTWAKDTEAAGLPCTLEGKEI